MQDPSVNSDALWYQQNYPNLSPLNSLGNYPSEKEWITGPTYPFTPTFTNTVTVNDL